MRAPAPRPALPRSGLGAVPRLIEQALALRYREGTGFGAYPQDALGAVVLRSETVRSRFSFPRHSFLGTRSPVRRPAPGTAGCASVCEGTLGVPEPERPEFALQMAAPLRTSGLGRFAPEVLAQVNQRLTRPDEAGRPNHPVWAPERNRAPNPQIRSFPSSGWNQQRSCTGLSGRSDAFCSAPRLQDARVRSPASPPYAADVLKWAVADRKLGGHAFCASGVARLGPRRAACRSAAS